MDIIYIYIYHIEILEEVFVQGFLSKLQGDLVEMWKGPCHRSLEQRYLEEILVGSLKGAFRDLAGTSKRSLEIPSKILR
jgi:hypothetical protein